MAVHYSFPRVKLSLDYYPELKNINTENYSEYWGVFIFRVSTQVSVSFNLHKPHCSYNIFLTMSIWLKKNLLILFLAFLFLEFKRNKHDATK